MTALDALLARVLHLPPAIPGEVRQERDLEIPMPDGAVLRADRYWAEGRPGDPLVLTRGPYGRAGLNHLLGRAFAARGLQCLNVSCRGTFSSTGEWFPMRDEARDGLATHRWVTEQPWFPGSMILAGPSYLGYTQWATAAQEPGSIAAMVPHVTSSRLTLPFIRPDALDWDLLVRWNFLLEHQEDRFAVPATVLRLNERRLQRAMSTLPRNAVDQQLAGHRWQFFQDCLDHDSQDPHWSDTDHSGAVGRLQIPASYVGGWYDIFLADQLRDYAATVRSGAPQRLTIGPWTHSSPAGFGAATAEAVFFASPFARGEVPAERAPVRLYVMGTGAKGSPVPGVARNPPAPWRDFQSWPPEGYPEVRLHLAAGGELHPQPPAGGATAYRYDPADPTPSAGGPFLSVGAGPADNRALEKRADVVVFSTAPLTGDVEVIGEVSAEIWFSSSAADTDVFVRLCDVDGRGRSRNICDGIARFHREAGDPEVVPVRVELWPTAYLFRAGHRIRLQVSSASHPRYARNLNTGGSRASATRMQVADQRVWHGVRYASAVSLPVAGAHHTRLG